MSPADPFTGIWKCNVERSRLSSPPRTWIQQIQATPEHMHVREEIIRSDGSKTIVTVEADFDGKDYPVSGSPIADAIAYTRVGACITGTAKKNGAVSVWETLVVSLVEPVLTMTFSLFSGAKQISSGVAVFEKVQPPAPAAH